jgi:hypothetical protein
MAMPCVPRGESDDELSEETFHANRPFSSLLGLGA